MSIVAKLPDLGKAFERFKAQNLPEKSGHPVAGAGEETGGNGAVLTPKCGNLTPDPETDKKPQK